MVTRVVSVLFQKSGPGLVVRWRVRDQDLALRWFDVLRRSLPYGVNERERVYDFPNQKWSRARVCDEMTDCMRKIEGTYPGFFRTWPHPNMDSSVTNIMHADFELLRGESFQPTSLYTDAPYETQMEICRYNLLIHRWESLVNGGQPKIACTFLNNHWTEFAPSDYQHFTLDQSYGALLLSYAQVGKQLLEVWRDGDDEVSAEGIRPMNGFAADFVAKFSQRLPHESKDLRCKLMQWYDARADHFRSLGLHKDDPSLAIGHVQVGDLIEDHDRETLIRGIGENDRIEEVWIDEIN